MKRAASSARIFEQPWEASSRTAAPHASAFTGVGHRVTWLCRSFARLNAEQAAVVLIHEALHFAGLTERPADPEALPSARINRLVQESCEF